MKESKNEKENVNINKKTTDTKSYVKIWNFIKKYYKDAIFLLLLIFIIFYNSDYVVYKPGGAIDLTDRISINDSADNDGKYSLSYVSVTNGNIPNIIAALFIKDWDIVAKSSVTYDNYDYETMFKLEQVEYQNSIAEAINVAYTKAGKTFTITKDNPYVIYIASDADTDFQLMDRIISVDGNEYTTLDDLSAYIKSKKVGDKLSIKVENNGTEYERYAIIYKYNDNNIMGVSIINKVDYETDPEINIKTSSSEAGSSGGLMLSLAIYDKLMDEDISKGLNIMGTGTISSDGTVGSISGVKYKLLGAKKSKADVFFIPADNYDEAKEVYDKYNLSFDLVKVETIDDALNYLASK